MGVGVGVGVGVWVRGSIVDIISPFVKHATRLQIYCEDGIINWCEVV